jgi:hypothetical protein
MPLQDLSAARPQGSGKQQPFWVKHAIFLIFYLKIMNLCPFKGRIAILLLFAFIARTGM